MSSSPPNTPSQESSSSISDDQSLCLNSDDNQQVPSNTQTPSPISSFSTHPENIPKKPHIILDQPVDASIISQGAQSLASALDEGSRNASSSDQQANNVVRPQKPAAVVIKDIMSLLPPGRPAKIKIRMSAPPHLQIVQSPEEDTTTGVSPRPTKIPRNVENAPEEPRPRWEKNIRKEEQARPLRPRSPRPWWKKNIRKEKEARALMPPPGQRSSVNNRVQEAQRNFNFGEEDEKELKRRKLSKPPESEGRTGDQKGEESRFLFPLSESEGEDDLQMLKFLCAYISNGAHIAPRFKRVIADFINGIILAENCRIKSAGLWEKVLALHKKFQRLVQQNGGENFREADFSRACDHEKAELCKLIWRDRKESERSGPYSDPDTDKMKLVSDNVSGVEGISPGIGVIVEQGNESSSDQEMKVDHGNVAGLAVNVDPGIGSSDQGMNVDGGNAAGLVVDVDRGDGADPEVTLGQGSEAGIEPGVMTMDHGNEPDPGAAADQKKDSDSVAPLPTELNSPISGDSEQNTREA